MRVLVVLYHVGDALATTMERSGVSASDIQTWCLEWEECVTACSDFQGLGWLRHADGLVRLVNRYHVALQDREVVGNGPR